MKGNIFRKYKRLTGFFLTVLFVFYFGSVTFYPHTHIVDGVPIVHSHPFKSHNGNHIPGHNHSEKGLLLIQFISCLITTVPVVFALNRAFQNVFRNLTVNKESWIILSFFFPEACRPRAPTL